MAITKVTDSLVDFDSLGITGNGEVLTIAASTGTSQVYQKYSSDGGNHYIGVASSAGAGLLSGAGAYSLNIQTEGARNVAIGTNNTLRMLINSSGEVAIGASVASPFLLNVGSTGNDSQRPVALSVGSTAGRTQISFNNANGAVGSIVSNGSATSYSTSSDYRLKENVVTDWDATTRLKQLKPSRFNFIADADTTVDGFLAHEVSDIVPEAITGEKDATETYTDEDGNEQTRPVYQGIDQAKLVPLLVKTIQELEARITTLENA